MGNHLWSGRTAQPVRLGFLWLKMLPGALCLTPWSLPIPPSPPVQILSFRHACTPSLSHPLSLMHSLSHALTHIHSFIHSFAHALMHSFTHSLVHSFMHHQALIHSLTNSFTPSLLPPAGVTCSLSISSCADLLLPPPHPLLTHSFRASPEPWPHLSWVATLGFSSNSKGWCLALPVQGQTTWMVATCQCLTATVSLSSGSGKPAFRRLAPHSNSRKRNRLNGET